MRSPALPLVALAGVAALTLTACTGNAAGPTPGATGTLVDGKTFTAVIPADPGTLDPFITAMSVARNIDRFLYSRLIEVQNDGTVIAGLAEKWEADATKASFTLRAGATCEDGTPITATDVADNINRIADPATASPMLGLNVQPATKATGDDASRTVSVTSGRPDAFLLLNVGGLSIVCSTVLDDPKARAAGKGATGMFTLTESVPNNQYTLTRRKDFTWGAGDWDPKQKGLPDKAVFRVVPNETTAVNLVLSGEVTGAQVLGPDKARLRSAGLHEAAVPASLGQIVYNQKAGKATADEKVREALSRALNLEELRKIISGGAGTQPQSMVTVAPAPCRADVVSGHLPTLDAAAAATALDEAGWKAGSDGVRSKDGTPLQLKLLSSSMLGESGRGASEYVQAAWKKLGVAVEVRDADGPQISETLFASGDWDVSLVPLNVALPSQLVPFYSGPASPNGSNFASVSVPAYDEAVARAATKPGTEGCDDWGLAEQALFDSFSVIPFADEPRVFFSKNATVASGDGIDPFSIRMYE